MYVRVNLKVQKYVSCQKNTTPGPCVVTDERVCVMFSETSVLFQTIWCNIIKGMRDFFVSMSSSQTETPNPVNIFGIFYTRTVNVVNYVTVTTCKHHVVISLCYHNLSSYRCIQFPWSECDTTGHVTAWCARLLVPISNAQAHSPLHHE